jgi:hypothetical protein
MKKLLIIIICIVLFNTSCTQSSTTPSAPPANTSIYSIDSTYFFKINFNGQTLSQYGVFANYGSSGSGYVSYPGIVSGVLSTGTLAANSGGLLNLYIQNTNVSFYFNLNRVGDTVNSPIGAYDLHGSASAGITDLNTSKGYTMDTASTLLNVTNINVSSVIGVMSGKLIDGTSLIPFTGSFCFKKIL